MPSSFQTQRLRKHADYGLVYGASRKHTSASLAFFYRERTGDSGTPRLGITVPRALGGAVLRNRIKRRLRIAARVSLPMLPAGLDVVLHPRPTVATMPYPALLAELAAAYGRVAQRVAARADNAPQPRGPRRGRKR